MSKRVLKGAGAGDNSWSGGRLPSGVSCRPRRYFVKFHFTQSLLNTESEAVRFSTKEAPRRLHHICNCEAVLYETKSEAITPAGVPLQPASQVPSTRYTKQHLHPRRGPITGHRSNRAPRAPGSERALPWSEALLLLSTAHPVPVRSPRSRDGRWALQ